MFKKSGIKDTKLTYRAPRTLRKAIKWGAKKLGVSQSDFVVLAVDEFLDKLERDEPSSSLTLPEGFTISSKDNRMMGINVDGDIIPIIDSYTYRFYHSRTRLILWAVALKALELAAAKKTENNS